LSRVEIATQPFGVVEDENRLRPGLTVSFAHRDGSAATVYDALTGGSPISPLVTNDNGEIPGFLEQGSYVLTVGTTKTAVTHNVEAVVGSVPQSSVPNLPGSSVCVTTSSALIVPSNPSRIELFLTLLDTVNYVDIAFADTATLAVGTRLWPFSPPLRIQSYTGPVAAISAVANVYVAIVEV
jgi:hypothetical protein